MAQTIAQKKAELLASSIKKQLDFVKSIGYAVGILKGRTDQKIRDVLRDQIENRFKNMQENFDEARFQQAELDTLTGSDPSFATGDRGQITEATRLRDAALRGVPKEFHSLVTDASTELRLAGGQSAQADMQAFILSERRSGTTESKIIKKLKDQGLTPKQIGQEFEKAGRRTTGTPQGTAKSTDQDVKNLYQQYFDRDPSAAELKNWGVQGGADTTNKALENFLKQEQIRYGYPSPTAPDVPTTAETGLLGKTGEQTPIAQPDTAAQKQALFDYIEGLGLPLEEQAILREIVGGEYKNELINEEDINKIVKDAAVSAEVNLSPYYEKITGRTLDDLKQSMADLRSGADIAVRKEAASYADTLSQTKQNLRARGLTF